MSLTPYEQPHLSKKYFLSSYSAFNARLALDRRGINKTLQAMLRIRKARGWTSLGCPPVGFILLGLMLIADTIPPPQKKKKKKKGGGGLIINCCREKRYLPQIEEKGFQKQKERTY